MVMGACHAASAPHDRIPATDVSPAMSAAMRKAASPQREAAGLPALDHALITRGPIDAQMRETEGATKRPAIGKEWITALKHIRGPAMGLSEGQS